jgi:hypothetical protein
LYWFLLLEKNSDIDTFNLKRNPIKYMREVCYHSYKITTFT